MNASHEAESTSNKDLWIKPEIRSLNAADALILKEGGPEGGFGSEEIVP